MPQTLHSLNLPSIGGNKQAKILCQMMISATVEKEEGWDYRVAESCYSQLGD